MTGYHRLLLLMASLAGILIALHSCATSEARLKKRATDFYNTLYKLNGKGSIGEFFLPSVRRHTQRGEGAQYLQFVEEGLASTQKNNPVPVKGEEVRVRISGRFGVSWVETRGDNPLHQASPIKWVKVRGRWFLFQGPREVLEDIGPFPLELLPRGKEERQ